MTEGDARTGPGPAIRLLGRAVNAAMDCVRWSWRLTRSPVRSFFDRAAPRWDERVRIESPEYLAPLVAALERIVGGRRASWTSARGRGRRRSRSPRAVPMREVVGIDISAEMVARARANVAERGSASGCSSPTSRTWSQTSAST
jgi:hypothetical protein